MQMHDLRCKPSVLELWTELIHRKCSMRVAHSLCPTDESVVCPKRAECSIDLSRAPEFRKRRGRVLDPKAA